MKRIIAAAVLGAFCTMSGANAANIIRMNAPIPNGVHVEPKQPTFSLSKPAALTAKIGRAFSYDFSTLVTWANLNDQAAPALSFSSDFLPDGLSLSNAGIVTGTSKTKGSYPVSITASDGKTTQTLVATLDVDSPYAKQTCDSQWSSVKYYIDGGSSTPFESKAGLSVSQSAGLSIGDENPTADGKALKFTGTSYLAFNDNSAENLGAADFTIEAFVKPDTKGNYTVVSKGNVVNVSYGSYQLVTTSGGNFAFYASTGNGWAVSTVFGSYNAATWTQVAVTRQGNVWRFFQDGQLLSTANVAGSILTNSGLGLQVGHGRSGNFTSGPLYYPMQGYIQGLRVSSIARYTASYTPTGIAGGSCN